MSLGKALIAAGAVLALAGVALQLVPALRLGRLPGDLSIGGEGWRVYVPLGSSLLISIVLTLVLAGVSALLRR